MFLALAIGGCGGDSGDDETTTDTKDVARVVSALDTASRAGDGERICRRLFTPKLAESVSNSSKSGKCAAEVKAKLFSPDAKISVKGIAVPDRENATATVKETNGNTSTLFLVKQSGQWRIRSVAPA
ncbi:MAG TPA: hypothetical protein VEQ61_03260 [Thermoleophilaceae bacterium]|nr:hypothetical protein [Thermoleophilaceae bacterium]